LELAEFYNASPKIGEGAKTRENSVDFIPFRTLIANISGMRQDIQNQKDVRPRVIPPAFHEKKSGVVWFTYYKELHCEFRPTKMHFLGDDHDIFSRGCCAMIFLHALEIDQALLAHTTRGQGPPKQKKIIVKI